MSPNIHPAVSIEDAMTMLDSRVPLTYRERKMIVESLWKTAYEKGHTSATEFYLSISPNSGPGFDGMTNTERRHVKGTKKFDWKKAETQRAIGLGD